MPSSARYSTMQQQQPATATSSFTTYQQHRRHYQVSPAPPVLSLTAYSNQRISTSTPRHYQYPTSLATPAPAFNQSSAYFVDRVDLDDYSIATLRQTVENLLATTNGKGWKVKLALPEEGLIVDNVLDPSQSWGYERSELLYLWQDPSYSNVIVIVTRKRSRHHHHHHHASRPYSASVFRLRGLESAQNFLEHAQRFFGQLTLSPSITNIIEPNRHNSSDKSSRTLPSKSRRSKPRLSVHDGKTRSMSIEPLQSKTSTTPIRLITRAEFDPGKSSTNVEEVPPSSSSIRSVNSARTLSETTSSSESSNAGSIKEVLSFSKKWNGRDHDDNDDKMTTISNNLSVEYVAELLRELKELRHEITRLKVERKPDVNTRSVSTSPLLNGRKKTKESSTSMNPPFEDEMNERTEVDAQTQTDFRPLVTRRRTLIKKNKKTMIGVSAVSGWNSNRSSTSSIDQTPRTNSSSSTTTGSEPEESTQDSSSQMNDSLVDSNATQVRDEYQPIILAAPPRPTLMRNPINSISFNYSPLSHPTNTTNEEGSNAQSIPIMVEKEMTPLLANGSTPPSSSSSSNMDFIRVPPPPTMIPITSSTFPAAPPLAKEHIYENIPTLMQTLSHSRPFLNAPMLSNEDTQQQLASSSNVYPNYPMENSAPAPQSNGNSYLPHGQVLNNSPPSKEVNPLDKIDAMPTQKPQIISAGRHRSQPVYFANHLTNPLFNIDKQLLINTIANQFGVDLNSPQLQNLVSNQHLFVARKRTFANMVWQMTPDEESALCSSPATLKETINFDSIETDSNIATRPILKANKTLPSTTKRRNITWDTTLE